MNKGLGKKTEREYHKNDRKKQKSLESPHSEVARKHSFHQKMIILH